MIKWNNGDRGSKVKDIIDGNFDILSKYLNKIALCLSTSERNGLSGQYLSDGLMVYDTTENKWYQYKNGGWILNNIGGDEGTNCFIQTFSSEDWDNKTILIPKAEHGASNPFVQLFIFSNNVYYEVSGGFVVDSNDNIRIESDESFSGKVVVK